MSNKITFTHAIGHEFQITGEPNKDGNWFVSADCGAESRHDFEFHINGEDFQLTGVEMLEALRAHAAARVIKGMR